MKIILFGNKKISKKLLYILKKRLKSQTYIPLIPQNLKNIKLQIIIDLIQRI